MEAASSTPPPSQQLASSPKAPKKNKSFSKRLMTEHTELQKGYDDAFWKENDGKNIPEEFQPRLKSKVQNDTGTAFAKTNKKLNTVECTQCGHQMILDKTKKEKKALSAYNVYVKNEYQKIKDENPTANGTECLRLVAAKWKESKKTT